jgi:hypothetical protein
MTSFPDVNNLFKNMDDNIKVNAASLVAPYVIMAFLFKILLEFPIPAIAVHVTCFSTVLVGMFSFFLFL